MTRRCEELTMIGSTFLCERSRLLVATTVIIAGCMAPSDWRYGVPISTDVGTVSGDAQPGADADSPSSATGIEPNDPDHPSDDTGTPSLPDVPELPPEDEPPSRPVDLDGGSEDTGTVDSGAADGGLVDSGPEEEPEDADDPTPTGGAVSPGGPCACDTDCQGDALHAGLCIHGICGTVATSSDCEPGSSIECPVGQRCWNGTGFGVCYPDYDSVSCYGIADGDGSCVTNGYDCYQICGALCDLPGEPGDGPAPCDDPSGGG